MQTVIVDHKQNLEKKCLKHLYILRLYDSVLFSVACSRRSVPLYFSSLSLLRTALHYLNAWNRLYFPMFTSLLLLGIDPKLERQEWDLTMNMIFMNSSISPILYCWRLREVRTAVLKIIRKLLCKQTKEN